MRLIALIASFALASVVWATQPPRHHHAPAPHHQHGSPIHRPPNVRPIAPIQGSRTISHNYHTRFGTHFKHGYYYRGWNHNHWSRHYWDNRYGAYLYWDPYALSWFYWCAPHFAFYPVSYVPLGNYSFPYEATPAPPPASDGSPQPEIYR